MKRFKWNGRGMIDNLDGTEIPQNKDGFQDLIEYCNTLNEEIEALKRSDTITNLETEIMHLKAENKKLKEKIYE